jgi:hypothetical protein
MKGKIAQRHYYAHMKQAVIEAMPSSRRRRVGPIRWSTRTGWTMRIRAGRHGLHDGNGQADDRLHAQRDEPARRRGERVQLPPVARPGGRCGAEARQGVHGDGADGRPHRARQPADARHQDIIH